MTPKQSSSQAYFCFLSRSFIFDCDNIYIHNAWLLFRPAPLLLIPFSPAPPVVSTANDDNTDFAPFRVIGTPD